MRTHHLTTASLLILTITAWAPASLAQEPDGERKKLEAVVKKFKTDFDSGNYQGVIDAVPPKVIATIAKNAGAPEAELKKFLVEQTTQMMQQVKVVSFAMDLDGVKIEKTSSGRHYALIPTSTIMEVPGAGKLKAENTTVGLVDDGKWYLARVESDQQQGMLINAFPDFKTIDIPSGTMDPME